MMYLCYLSLEHIIILMAIYSLNAKLVSRGKGQSLVGQTAYITRSSIVDERTGVMHSYSEKMVDSVSAVLDKSDLFNEKKMDDDALKSIEHHDGSVVKKNLNPSPFQEKNGHDSVSNKAIDLMGDHRVKEIVISDVVLPTGASSELKDPGVLANAIELFEDELADKRFRVDQKNPEKAAKSALAKEQFLNSAQTAQSLIIALRRDASLEQQKESVETYIDEVFTSRSLPAIYSLHLDDHNPHVHIKVGRRQLIEGEFSEYKDRWIVSREGLMHMRYKWAEVDNEVARSYGDFEAIDYRSHSDRGLKISPTRHEGWFGKYIQSVGDISRIGLENQAIRLSNLDKENLDPSDVVQSVMAESGLFTRSQLMRSLQSKFESDSAFQELHKSISGFDQAHILGKSDIESMSCYWADKCIQSDSVSCVSHDHNGYELFGLKASQAHEEIIVEGIKALDVKREYGKFFNRAILDKHVDEYVRYHNKHESFSLSDEQVKAIRSLTGEGSSIRVLNGAAGTGKTKGVIKPVAELFESRGYRVWGASFQASVAQLLKEDIGSNCHTLHSLKHQWEKGTLSFGKKDVLIIDEAGMVASDLYEPVLKHIKESGAQLILVGDTKQILSRGGIDTYRMAQSIAGCSNLTQIIRQNKDWMREASEHFATHDVERGLHAYHEQGRISFHEDIDEISHALSAKFIDRLEEGCEVKDVLVSAHTNKSVGDLNKAIRSALISNGTLSSDVAFNHQQFKTPFSVGDRIIFTNNDNHGRYVKEASFFKSDLGIKNNDTGEIIGFNRVKNQVKVKLDSDRVVKFDASSYKDFDYAYARTTNKIQGVTYEYHYPVIEQGAGANKGYVGFTRHKSELHAFVNQEYEQDFNELAYKLGRSEIKYSYHDHASLNLYQKKLLGDYIHVREELKDLYGLVDRPKERIEFLKSDLKDHASDLLKEWDKIESLCLKYHIRHSILEEHAGIRSKVEFCDSETKHCLGLIDRFVKSGGFDRINLGYQVNDSLKKEDVSRFIYQALSHHQIGGKDFEFASLLYRSKGLSVDRKAEFYDAYHSYQSSSRAYARSCQAPTSDQRQAILSDFKEVLTELGERDGIKLSLIDFCEFKSDEDYKRFDSNKLSWRELKSIGHEIVDQYHDALNSDSGIKFLTQLKTLGEQDSHLDQLKSNRLKAGADFYEVIGKENLLSAFDERFGDKVIKDHDHHQFIEKYNSYRGCEDSDSKIKLASEIHVETLKNPIVYGAELKKYGPYMKEELQLVSKLSSFEGNKREALKAIQDYVGCKTRFQSYCASLKVDGNREVVTHEALYDAKQHLFRKELLNCVSHLNEKEGSEFRRVSYLALRDYSNSMKQGALGHLDQEGIRDHIVTFYKSELGSWHSRWIKEEHYDQMIPHIQSVAEAESSLQIVSSAHGEVFKGFDELNARRDSAQKLLEVRGFKNHLVCHDASILKGIEKLVHNYSAQNNKEDGAVHSKDGRVFTPRTNSGLVKHSADLDEIKERISSSAKEIAIQFLGSENKQLSNTSQLRFGKKGSLSVTLSGSRAGMWHDFEKGEGGHLFNLAMRETGMGFKEALTHFSDELGLNTYVEKRSTVSKKPLNQIAAEDKKRAEKKQMKVDTVLKNTKSIKGTVAEKYLNKRGLDIKGLSRDLRFHPGIYDHGTKKNHPALVCVSRNVEGNVKAIQVIHLNDQGDKAKVDVVKRSQGLVKGSFVEVQTGDISKDNKLYLAEGPETAASIANARPNSKVFATLGISNFKNLPAKYKNHEIVICADHDNPIKKHQAVSQVQKSIDHLRDQGFKVSVVKPEKEGHDFNDVLKHEGHEELDKQLRATQEQLHQQQHTQQMNMGRGR